MSDRKLRLYACACARWTWHEPPDDRCRIAVETAERFADGLTSAEELAAVYWPARRVPLEQAKARPGEPTPYHLIAPADAAARCAFAAAHTGALDAGWTVVDGTWRSESASYAALADLARDVFGDPCDPVPLGPGWCSPEVVDLAGSIYAGRGFERMPLLADALARAGCDDPEILDHCRRGGLHARGCWVIDLLLGRE